MWKTLAITLINRALPILIGELWAFLKDTVATYDATADLTSAQKREMVLIDSAHHLQTAGLNISASLLNLGIEAALAVVRSRAGQ